MMLLDQHHHHHVLHHRNHLARHSACGGGNTTAGRRLHPAQRATPAATSDGSSSSTTTTTAITSSSTTSPSSLLSQAPPICAPSDHGSPAFCWWHDEKRFRGSGDDSLVQHALLAAGGVRVGGNPKYAATPGPQGAQVADRWDLLWSTSDGAHKAAPLIKPEEAQLINAIPGLQHLTRKRHFAATLSDAFGEDAWQLAPRSYSIPGQLLQWRQHLAEDTRGDSAAWWVLKTGEHLGAGLRLAPSSAALAALLERNRPYLTPPQELSQPPQELSQQHQQQQDVGSTAAAASSSQQPKPPRPFITVQQYLTCPLLIDGRKFGLRLWVLVLGPRPYRAFLHTQGLVLFSGHSYNPDLTAASRRLGKQGHLTNAALWAEAPGSKQQQQQPDLTLEQLLQHANPIAPHDPRDQPVWTLQQLKTALGPVASEQLWQRLSTIAARVVAAAAGPVQEAAAQRGWTGDAAFELLGLDFVLDAAGRPRLLEVNASPSLAWRTSHQPLKTSALMWGAKQAAVLDMVSLLRLQDRFPPAGAGLEERSQPVEHQCQRLGQPRRQRRRAEAVNPVLLRAASARYFASRPLVAQLVRHAQDCLADAAAAAPSRQHVEARVQAKLQRLRAEARDQHALLEAHVQHLVQVECEAASGGGWQPLRMPRRAEALAAGWRLHIDDADEALRLWQQLQQH